MCVPVRAVGSPGQWLTTCSFLVHREAGALEPRRDGLREEAINVGTAPPDVRSPAQVVVHGAGM